MKAALSQEGHTYKPPLAVQVKRSPSTASALAQRAVPSTSQPPANVAPIMTIKAQKMHFYMVA
jgi:hypothetical protein